MLLASSCLIAALAASRQRFNGRTLLTRGQSAFDELRQGIQEIEFLSDPTTGEMKVPGQEAIAAILSPVLESFLKQYPGGSFSTFMRKNSTDSPRDCATVPWTSFCRDSAIRSSQMTPSSMT